MDPTTTTARVPAPRAPADGAPTPTVPLPGGLRRSARAVAPLVPLVVLALAAGALHRRLGGHRWDRVGEDLAAVPAGSLALAGVATALSYLAMTGYDGLALRYVGHRVPYRRYAAASFVATAFGNSLGASALVGAALRARAYSAWGVPAAAGARVAAVNLVTLSLGCAAVVAAGSVLAPGHVAAALGLPAPAAVGLGVGLGAVLPAYVLWAGSGKPPVVLRRVRVERPSRALAVAQAVVSVVEWLAMALVLWALLPRTADVGFAAFALVFVVATTAGLVSTVPGGLGVFETVLLAGLGGAVAPGALVATLVAYRLVYFAAPLVLAGVGLLAMEAWRGRGAVASSSRAVRRRPALALPTLAAVVCAAVGVLLVVTGDAPGDSAAPDLTAFSASLGGLVLLLLARGLHRRLRGALLLAVVVAAAVLGVAVGHRATPLAVSCAALLTLLLAGRGAFHRTTSVLADPRGRVWWLTAAATLAVLVTWHDLGRGASVVDGRTVLGASVAGDLPPGVRTALAAAVVAVVVAGARLLAPLSRRGVTASDEELRRAEPVLAAATHGNASLLWTGDKQVVFSGAGGALLMYQVRGRSWVVMGDPVGDPDEFDDLLRRFLDRCDRRCGRPVFYSVRDDLADLYRAHGLRLAKLGEEAVVPLEGFGLDGKGRSKLRSECSASRRKGCEVEVVDAADVGPLLPQLREVSDAWLGRRQAAEKRFSLGAFDEDYVRRFPVVVARVEGRVVAFATLWASGARHEVKVDLMRRVHDAPRTVMSHLFVEAMLWAGRNGYSTFSLGMAPLSGLGSGGGASWWERAGTWLWERGERFYNFRGLRQFKERFHPRWEPRYVASPGGPALPAAMLDVATLVGGGVTGMLTRAGSSTAAPAQAAAANPF